MASVGRRVVLGVSGRRTTHVVDWAARLLWPGDAVQIMHAYRPIPYAATDWQLPAEQEELVRDTVRHYVDTAAAKLRQARPDLVVTETFAGRPVEIALSEAAKTADLVLVGIPHSDLNRHMLIRLFAGLDCPVVVIGAERPTAHPTIAALLRGDLADRAVLAAAFDQAARERRGLLVLKAWQPPLDGNLRYAETAEQKALDSFLADWQQRYPEVGVAAELRFGVSPRALIDQAGGAELLVLGLPRPATDQAYFEAALDEVIAHRSLSSMLVPERQLTHSSPGGPAIQRAER